MNRGTEDYVKAIYKLQQWLDSKDYVSNKSLGTKLGHTAQTVNEMIKKLVAQGYVVYTRYKGTRLTDQGTAIAISMMRKHRLWELFLVKELGYSWEEVHAEAEQLEHVTSTLLEGRLYKHLGQPKHCPHGNPIPSLEGQVEVYPHLKLSKAVIGTKYKLVSVVDDKALLVYLDQIAFRLGDLIILKDMDTINETYIITKDKKTYTFGEKVANKMYLKKD